MKGPPPRSQGEFPLRGGTFTLTRSNTTLAPLFLEREFCSRPPVVRRLLQQLTQVSMRLTIGSDNCQVLRTPDSIHFNTRGCTVSVELEIMTYSTAGDAGRA